MRRGERAPTADEQSGALERGGAWAPAAQKGRRCSISRARKPPGAAASAACWRAAGSPARPTARSSPPWVRPWCWPPPSAKGVKPGQGFFPLTVNYQEKAFAAGKIPGGFFKREGRPTEKETLTSRLIDRPIRPLFPEGSRTRPGRRHRAGPRRRQRPRHPGHGRGLGRVTISGVPFRRPDRGGPCRLHERRVHPQPDRRADPRERPRSGRRRHARRRDDGRVRGQELSEEPCWPRWCSATASSSR